MTSSEEEENVCFDESELQEFLNEQHSSFKALFLVVEKYSVYPGYLIFANLRCGLWYLPKFDGTCYFKSTDGHANHWQFSLSRLNLHVLHAAIRHGGVIIVDSTRKGKRFPDSFNRTIPIWCGVLNRLKRCLYGGSTAVQSASGEERGDEQAQQKTAQREDGAWQRIPLPDWVPESEKSRLDTVVEGFVGKVLESGVGLEELDQLSKPLGCFWICPSQPSPPPLEGCGMLPLLLVSASKETSQGNYVQGAGDDQESWSLGLTPSLFWSNREFLLGPGEAGIESRIRSLVSSAAPCESASPAALPCVSAAATGGTATQIGSTNIFLSDASVHALSDRNFAVIDCSATKQEFNCSGPYLFTPISRVKSDLAKVSVHLPRVLAFAVEALKSKIPLLILCCGAIDIGVCFVLAILSRYFSPQGTQFNE